MPLNGTLSHLSPDIILKHRFSSSFVFKVFPLLKSKWLIFSIQEMSLYFIHVLEVFIWIARSVAFFCKKWLSCQHQFNYVLIKMVYLFFFTQKKTTNEANWSEETNRKMQNKLHKALLCEINNGQRVDLYIVFASQNNFHFTLHCSIFKSRTNR